MLSILTDGTTRLIAMNIYLNEPLSFNSVLYGVSPKFMSFHVQCVKSPFRL